MTKKPPGDVTELLKAAAAGEQGSADGLIRRVYNELHGLAQAKMAREPSDHTLQATALVHEAYLRLVGDEKARWQNRAHFFGAAAEAMRRILIERARRARSLKRGGGRSRSPLDQGEVPGPDDSAGEILALSEALDDLERMDPRGARVVKLRYFVGLSIEETAKILEVSPRTVKADWAASKAWLYGRLDPDSFRPPPGDAADA